MKMNVKGNSLLRKIYEAGLASIDLKALYLQSITDMIKRGDLQVSAEELAKIEGFNLPEIKAFHTALADSRDRQAFLNSRIS